MELVWTSGDGRTLALRGSDGYKVQVMDGFGGAPVAIQTTKAPYQDGETLVDQLLEPRILTLELMLVGDDVHARRRLLVSLFNPKLGTGTLSWERDGQTFAIHAVADGGPEFPSRWGQTSTPCLQAAIIHLRAPDPMWYDPEPESWDAGHDLGRVELSPHLPFVTWHSWLSPHHGKQRRHSDACSHHLPWAVD